MKIAIMGAGGIGAYFGARLAQAGEEVAFIARGAHLDAMRRHGLRIESANGDVHLKAPRVTGDPAEIGPVDMVLFTVKLWDTETAADAVRSLLGPETAVISLQNGIDAEDILAARLGAEHIMGGVAYILAVIDAPGVIRHTGTMARVVFGERGGAASARGAALQSAFARAEVNAEVSDDIDKDIWQKFSVVVPLSGITALTRLTIGPILATPETRDLLRLAVEEVAAVADAKGIALDDGLAARNMAFFAAQPAVFGSSMLHDIQAGRRLELSFLSGAVARLGAELDVPTPVNAFITAALIPHAEGTPG